MKQIIAVVRPHLVEQLLQALRLAPLEALEVTEVKGYGRQKSYLESYGASEYSQAFLPKIEVSCFVDDLRLEEVVKTISDACRTGRMGDGKMLIIDVPEMLSLPDGGDGAN